jgi:hypothetical protein
MRTAAVLEGAVMQINEILGQAKPVARLPEMDEAAIAKSPTLDMRAERPDAAPRPVTAKQPEAAVDSKHNPRRFGAGF